MLQQLGVNSTFFIQFVVFIAIISFLSIYVFGPYAKAVAEREKQTKGSEDDALVMDKHSVELYAEYEKKAREVHSSIQDVYKAARAEAQKEHEKAILAARTESENYLNENRKKIKDAVGAAEDALKKETPQIVIAMTQKLLGK